MLFDTTHVLYMLVSALLTAGALFLAARFLKTQEKKILALKIVAVVTVLLHYSNIWVEYFANGGSKEGLEGSHLIPIYPCHIMMWLLLITAFLKNKEGKVFQTFAEFCFWGGLVCGTIGLVLNENYGDNPTLLDWFVFKGLLSHSTLLLGCIYLPVGKFIKIRVANVISVTIGLCFFLVEGAFVNALYAICGLPEVNAMYLLHSPYPSLPWLSPLLMGAVGVALLFVGLALYELSFPKEERWYTKLWIYKERLCHNRKGE